MDRLSTLFFAFDRPKLIAAHAVDRFVHARGHVPPPTLAEVVDALARLLSIGPALAVNGARPQTLRQRGVPEQSREQKERQRLKGY